MEKAGRRILGHGAKAVLVKGGHLKGTAMHDMLITLERTEHFTSDPIATRHTHGTGCALASSIAAYTAQGLPLRETVAKARLYVRNAILTAPGLGQGNGPLNHAWPLEK